LPSTGAADLTDTFGVGVAGLTVAVFTVPQVFSLIVDAGLLLWAERRARGPMIGLGLGGMAASVLAAALAPSIGWFALAVALFFPSSTLACGLAQAALMDADPENRERRMAQWTLAGSVGDLAAPVVLWVGHASGLGWRAAWVATGVLLLIEAAIMATVRVPGPQPTVQGVPEAAADTADEVRDGFREQVRLLARYPALFLWLFGAVLCSLMDETLVTLLALWLRESGASSAAATGMMLALTAGGMVGLLILDRLLISFSVRALLVVSALGAAAFFALACSVGVWEVAIVGMFVAGAFMAAHYPLVQAQAYRCLPERSGLVAAAAQAMGPVELALPVLVGLLADRIGAHAALLALLAQPLGLLFVVAVSTAVLRRARKV